MTVIKQAETLVWISSMQAAMGTVVGQCATLRRSLQSTAVLPAPPSLAAPVEFVLPPAAATRKRAPFAAAPPQAAAAAASPPPPPPPPPHVGQLDSTHPGLFGGAPLPAAATAAAPATAACHTGGGLLPEAGTAEARAKLRQWTNATREAGALSESMRDVLTSMRELRHALSPQSLERLPPPPPPPPPPAAPARGYQQATEASASRNSVASKTETAKATKAAAKGTARLDKARFTAPKTTTAASKRAPSASLRARSPPRAGSSSRTRSPTKPTIRAGASQSKSPVRSRSASKATTEPPKHGQKAVASHRNVTSRSPGRAAAAKAAATKTKTTIRTKTGGSVTKARPHEEKGPKETTPLKTRGGGLKEMMAKGRLEKRKSLEQTGDADAHGVEIFESPQAKATATQKSKGDPKSPSPPPPGPKPAAAASAPPQAPLVLPGMFTAACRVVIRNGAEPTADEVGEVAKGDVVCADLQQGDYLRIVDLVGLHDPEKTLGETGAWGLIRNRVKTMLVATSPEDMEKAEATFMEQQEKRAAAAEPPPKKGIAPRMAATPPAAARPSPVAKPAVPSRVDGPLDPPQYFTAAGRAVIRNGAKPTADEVGEVAKGDVVCADMQTGDWIRVIKMTGLLEPDPKKATLPQTGAWALVRNRVKEILVAAAPEDVETVEATFMEQQEKRAAAVAANAPPAKRGSYRALSRASGMLKRMATPFAASPRPAAAPAAGNGGDGGGDGDDDGGRWPRFFRTTTACRVRAGPDASEEDIAEVEAGRVVKALERRGGWVRCTGLPEVMEAVARGALPPDVVYDYHVSYREGRGPPPGTKGMWLLLRNKRGKELLVQLDDDAGRGEWAKQAKVDPWAGEDDANQGAGGAGPGAAEGGGGEETGGEEGGVAVDDELSGLSTKELRQLLEERGLDGATPGQIGDERKAALARRLRALREGDVPGSVPGGEPDEEEEVRASLPPMQGTSMDRKMSLKIEMDEERRRAASAAKGGWPHFYVVVTGPLPLHSQPGVGGTLLQEAANGAILKAVGEVAGGWLEIELGGDAGKTTAFLRQPVKTSARCVVRVADDRAAEQQWQGQW